MSIQVMSLVWSRKIGSPSRKAVLMVMADAANSDGSGIWISKKSIAERSEVSLPTVKRAMAHLLENGLISEVGKRKVMNGFTVVYRIEVKAVENLENSQSDRVQNDTGQNEPRSPRTVTRVTMNRDTVHHEPQTTHEPPMNQVILKGARDPNLLDGLKSRLSEVTGDAVDWQAPSIAVLSVPLRWMMGENPCDLELDIVPTVAAICGARSRGDPIRSWNYFTQAILKARDQRLSPNPEAKEHHDRVSPQRFDRSETHDAAARIALAGLGCG